MRFGNGAGFAFLRAVRTSVSKDIFADI